MDFFGIAANLVDAAFLLLGKAGRILNARGNRICFIIECICLSYWLYMNLNRGLYSQAASAVVTICICIYGYWKWGKKDE